MSMIGNLLRVSQEELDAYLEDSSLLEKRIYDDESDEEDLALVDIDKSWEGILFLLTGQSVAELDHPMGQVLFSGQVIDEEQDLGYGPAHYLTPEQVKEVNAELVKITIVDLAQSFDGKRMMELGIYPEVWNEEGILEDYLAEYFKSVQDLYATAAENGEAVIVFIN